MTSKAERKRRKKAAQITMPGGETIPQRIAGPGRPRKCPEDARRAALEARCRVSGIPVTPDTLKAAVAPSFGDDVGLCIHASAKGDQAAAMWATFCRIGAARRLYRMRYLGQTGDPQNAAIAMQSDAMMVDPDLRVDMRSPEERDAAAKRAEAYWRERLDMIRIPQHRMALRSAADGFGGPWWRDGKPTQAGLHVVEGLRVVVEGGA